MGREDVVMGCCVLVMIEIGFVVSNCGWCCCGWSGL